MTITYADAQADIENLYNSGANNSAGPVVNACLEIIQNREGNPRELYDIVEDAMRKAPIKFSRVIMQCESKTTAVKVGEELGLSLGESVDLYETAKRMVKLDRKHTACFSPEQTERAKPHH